MMPQVPMRFLRRQVSPLVFVLLLLPLVARGLDPETLPEVGYHPGGIAYWDTPQFANALANGGAWLEFAPGQWGQHVAHWNNPQFDANGFPRYLNPGTRLRAITFALHADPGDSRPATWPRRSRLAEGRVVLAWKGDADIRLNGGGTFLAADSTGPDTGSLKDGRRVYRFQNGGYVQWIEVHAINAADPVTDVKVWLPDPADPANASLEGHVFHPTFLARLADEEWGFVRTMDWQQTNANPQQDWADRRPPGHAFQTGTLNPREPAPGSPGGRGSGASFEHLVALANASGKDLWICVPHLATDDFVRRLARLVRFGSDGTEPYTSVQASPVHPGLDPGLRLFVEYSNEIWSNGYSFPQGDWAQTQAGAAGISKAQFNARRFCDVWRVFRTEFAGEEDRVVNVAAVFTAASSYTTPFLQEMAAHGPAGTPPVLPDVVAVTTYFGNGIQDFAFDTALARAGTDDPWFLTTATFDAGGGTMRPVSVPATDPYWTGAALERHLGEAFDEWERRLLSGDAREGAGPDAVGIGGGFEPWLKELADTTFPAPVPVVAYEGGPSLYTDNRDGGDVRDDGLTTFMEAMNRHPRMRDVYALHLNMAKAKGLWSHVGFVDVGAWGKYGQWGHLEHLDQDPDAAVKYRFLRDWIAEAGALNHVDRPVGTAPRFDTAHLLPVGVFGVAYSAEIALSGGEGARTVAVIGSQLPAGLEFDPMPGTPDRVRVHGTPQGSGLGFVMLRAVDGDGDPAWRTFSVRTVGGPDVLLEADLTGTNPARHLPWTGAYMIREGLSYSGISAGPGIIASDGDNALVWSQNMPPAEADATLALAIAEGEHLAFTIAPPPGATLDLRGAPLALTIRRLSYHAPRRYSLFTSVGGFADGDQVFDSPHDGGEDDQELRLALPDTPDYEGIAGPVEFRVVGHAGQYGGHRTSLVSLTVGGRLVTSAGMDGWRVE